MAKKKKARNNSGVGSRRRPHVVGPKGVPDDAFLVAGAGGAVDPAVLSGLLEIVEDINRGRR